MSTIISKKLIVTTQEIDSSSILTPSGIPRGDYTANPYIGCTHQCLYCYACYMRRFTGHKEPWGTFLDVKNWPALTNYKKFKHKEVVIGTVTDPYLPQEAIYKRTRKLLEELDEMDCKVTIITKSDLVLRDKDILDRMYHNPMVVFSINTLDEHFRSSMERAPSVERRINAMKELSGVTGNIRVGCFAAPLFPVVTNIPVLKGIIEAVCPYCDEIWLDDLHLRSNYAKPVMEYMEEVLSYSDFQSFRAAYRRNSRWPHYWRYVLDPIEDYAKKAGMEYINATTYSMKDRASDKSRKRLLQRELLGRPGYPVIINYMPYITSKNCVYVDSGVKIHSSGDGYNGG